MGNSEILTAPTKDPEIARIAELQIASMQISKNILMNEHSSSYKWLMASLLALNSGGLFYLRDIDFMHGYVIWAAVSFYLGVACALLIAVFGQRATLQMIPDVEKFLIFWVETSVSGEFDEEKFKTTNQDMQKSVKKGQWATRFGWFSFVGFTSGLIASYFGHLL